jgi:hypothetical protein
MLTISKLKRWSVSYYIDTAQAAQQAANDLVRAGGGLGEYYSEHETRIPVWLCAGNTHTSAALVGLTDAQRAGGEADAAVVARWLDDGITPNGANGRAFGARGVQGFDLTFCAPKSVSLARLPGLAAIAYQHETSRCGDPLLHTHVIVPNRQAHADGVMVSLDGTSLYHEARNADRLTTRSQQRQPRRGTQERDDEVRARVEQVLAVVQHHQHLTVANKPQQRVHRGAARLVGHAQRAGHRDRHHAWMGDRRQIDIPDTVTELGRDASRDLNRETGLAGAAGTGQGHQPVVDEQLLQVSQLSARLSTPDAMNIG